MNFLLTTNARTLRKLAVIALALLWAVAGCSGGGGGSGSGGSSTDTPVVAKGARQFGMDILDVPSVGGYASSISALKSLGGSFQTLHVNWSDVEGTGAAATSGTFSDPSNAFAALNAYAVSDGIKVTLRIHPVDAVGKFVPADLAGTRFNNATLQTRAKAMIDYVFTRISPANVTSLVMGNEVDNYNAAGDANFWADYADFLFQMNAFMRTNYPTVKLGYVITSRAVTDPTFILANSGGQRAMDVFRDVGWTGTVDFLGITHYPLDAAFQMKSNTLVAGVFQSLVNYTAKPIHIEEIGCSSAAATSGSAALQAEFFREVFKAWDTHASRIPSLAVLRMVDKTRLDAEGVATARGLTGNEAFIEYIRSLGIKSNDATPKAAFTALQSELQKRGF